MAGVPTSTYPGASPADYTDALDHLSAVAAGNSNINTHPGLMQALSSAKATPQQAQALDQYMAGVTAQNRYTLARAGAGTVDFTDDERSAMNAMGFDYSAADSRSKALQDVNLNGLGVAAGGASSSSAPAAPQAPQPAPKPSHGFWSHGILHGVGRVGYDALHNPVTNGMTEGYNVVNASLGGAISDVQSVEQHLGITSGGWSDDMAKFGGPMGRMGTLLLPKSDAKYGAALHAQRAEQMKALGYDPSSVWSGLAFDSHGYSKSDITPALDAWDAADGEKKFGWDAPTAMAKSLELMKDPKKFQDSIISDPSLTPEQVAQQLQAINSPEFTELTQRLNAQQQTFGHQTATGLAIDPLKHPRLYAGTAAATDLVTSFYIDPTMVAGKVVGGLRRLPLAIDSLYDTDKIVARLDPEALANQSGARKRVITGWQSMIDSTNIIRDSVRSGDTATAAAEYAKIQAKTPELVPLVGDFLGASQGKLRTAADDLGIQMSHDLLKSEAGKPITDLHEAAQYVASVGGLQRLAHGKAAIESTYMPGVVSRWGWRALKANRAAHAAYADSLRTQAAESSFLKARQAGELSEADQKVSDAAIALADPGVVSHPSVNLDQIRKLAPAADDGVAAETGALVASHDSALIGQQADDATRSADGVLASAQRAKLSGDWAMNLLPAERGQVAYNLRRYGSPTAPDGLAAGGWASPAAIAARSKLAMARWSNLLPINTRMDLASSDTAAKVRQYARFYLGKGPANALAAQFANGDLATRKTIVQGLFDQVAHAAGLSRTDAGREILKRTHTGTEAYTHVGPGWVIDGKQAALHQGQTTTSITLPSFKQLSDASARVGLYEATVGRVATNTHTDNLFNLFRIGILIRPATATRNIIEPYLKALLDGQFGMVARSRALTYSSSDELAALGEKLGVSELKGAVPPEVVQMAKANLAERIANGGSKHAIAVAQHTLSRVEKGDIAAMSGYGRTRIGSHLSDTLAHLTKFYHSQLLRGMDKTELKFADELAEVLPNAAHNFGEQVVADRMSPRGATDIRDITDAGLGPQITTYNLASGSHPLLDAERIQKERGKFTRTGFGLETTDHSVGQARYINALHTRTFGQPETSKAVIAALRPTGGAAIQAPVKDDTARAVEAVVTGGLAAPSYLQRKLSIGYAEASRLIDRLTDLGVVSPAKAGESRRVLIAADELPSALKRLGLDATTPPGGTSVGGDPIDSVVKALENENKRGTAFGRYYKAGEDGVATPAVTPDEIALGKRQWAQDVVNDFRYMLAGRDGTLNDGLADFIGKHGTAPDEKWFADNITRESMPERVLAPQYSAMPIGSGPNILAQALQDITGRAFNQIVEGSIKRQSSTPALGAHYLKARGQQEAAGLAKTLTDAGLSEASAHTLMMGQAIRSAYVRTAQMIDDPGQKTQFDIVARNLLMFPRAMQAFIRRWGGSLAADPIKARKMMLALEASEHSGIVYRNDQGDLTFTYPGSAVMRDAMVAVSKLPGFGNFAHFPVGMDMTGKLTMAAPGFDNPLRFSLSPMVNIPMREVFKLMPEHQSLWTEIDTALNGEVGASMAHQGALQSVLPSALNKLMAAHSEDERNSIFASSVTGAIAHLQAAGLAPDPSDPPSVQDRFVNQVKAQVRNQLYLRFAFGLVAPAAPSSLNENVDGSSAVGAGSGTSADYTFHLTGIRNLSQEYKSILGSVDGDVARATAIFVALHPEGLAYTIPATGAGIAKAYLPATKESLGWMESNLDFLNSYKSVSAYFLPKAKGEFDGNAYNAQLALGLRQKKSISEFYNDVQVAQATNEFYKQYNLYDQMRADSIAHGNPAQTKVLSSAWQTWKADFLDHNLLLKEKFADTSQNKVVAEQQVKDLSAMVQHGDVPDGLGPQVGQMIGVFNDYLTWKSQVPAGAQGDAQKQAVAQAVDDKLGGIAASDPRLTNLFNAVFRMIDRNLTKVD